MLGLKKIILSFIIINQSGFPRLSKEWKGISCSQQGVNEIIIYPLKPQIFKGNNLSGNSDFIYNRHKKKNVTRGILEPFVTFYYNFSGYPVQ